VLTKINLIFFFEEANEKNFVSFTHTISEKEIRKNNLQYCVFQLIISAFAKVNENDTFNCKGNPK
jgi:hypothetical protein